MSQARGQLIVVAGGMFAGKTARLIEHLLAAQKAGRRVAAFKHSLDTRYSAARLATHDGRTFAARVALTAAEIAALAGDAEVIGIDEAQFFGRALVPVCRELVAARRTVIAAGIDHDTWGQPFPPLPELKAIADRVEMFQAPCGVCGAPSPYSQRMVPVVGGQLVGGPGDYEPRCKAHFTPLPPPAPVYE